MTQEKSEGRNWVYWFEIPATDFLRAKAFYETIFDMEITATDFGSMKMGIFPHRETGGAIVQSDFHRPSPDGPMIYLEAGPDLTTVLERVVTAGGQILQDKKQISEEHGYNAMVLDTEGNRLALHSFS